MSFLQVGQPAPDFTCNAIVDNALKEISLSSYAEANHWVILLFFPKAWSPVCPTEIKAFSTRLEEFLYSRKCAVVFASTDSPDCLRAWNNASESEGGLGGVHMPLISDCNHLLSRIYGVLVEETGVAQRSLFLIDPKGIIRATSSNDVYVARNVSEVLRLLDCAIFKDENGEGCPADWQKGDKGLDIAKDKVEGTFDLKKTFTKWVRPTLTRAFSNNSQRSINSVLASGGRSRSDSNNDQRGPTSGNVPSSSPSSGRDSPMVSPKHVLDANRLSAHMDTLSASRMELQMEEALVRQRLENMNAALENYRQSSNTTVTS